VRKEQKDWGMGGHARNARRRIEVGMAEKMAHDEPYMAHVPPGKTGEIVWTFNRAGEYEFACLIAGHYQSGMVGTITVRAGKQ
jgi:uncharacterized cupredoxin-like copper-binding protein